MDGEGRMHALVCDPAAPAASEDRMIKSSPSASAADLSRSPSRESSRAEWIPVLHMVKEGIWALKWMPVMALALSVLAWLFNHHDMTGPATASCVTCEANETTVAP